MNLEMIFCGTPITLPEVLGAKEYRADRQKHLLSQPSSQSLQTPYCLLCFSMNIAGDIKAFPLGIAAFDEGLHELRSRIPESSILFFEESRTNTGPEARLLIQSSAQTIKRIAVAIEEGHPLGRLFDMDVLDEHGQHISRTSLHLPARTCFICGKHAKECARSRNHSLDTLRQYTADLLVTYWKNKFADTASSCAVRALLYEVSATPKPGLVDRNHSGSHKDMDFFTFLDSSSVLIPWMRNFFCIGWDYAEKSDHTLFLRLRFAGQEAERQMFDVTHGVNTHKGLIFAFAILLGALGKASYLHTEPIDASEVFALCSSLGSYAVSDLKASERLTAQDWNYTSMTLHSHFVTAGEQFYLTYGISGARGEAASGFPSARNIGLPALKYWRSQGVSFNDASIMTLLTLLSQTKDTNMIHRGGLETAEQCRHDAERILETIRPETMHETLIELDCCYIEKNLSPGGCADLLAISLFLLFLEETHMIRF